jgi:DNA-directed RNA polymerase subunit RPC12/RpoP
MRNKAIHASLPEYQKYEADKVAYLSIKLHRLIIKRKLYGCNFPYKESVNDKEFYEKFESSRIERVQKVIEESKKKAKTLDHCGCQILSDDDWSYMSIACPVCGSDATLFGDTDINVEVYSEDDYNEDLTFLASSFECEECGLKLLDAVELELAGIDAVRDRNTDLDKWHRDSAEPDYDDL